LLPGDARLLFDAFRRLLDRAPRVRLVLIGRPRAPIPADLVSQGAILETGFVSYDVLQTWLGAADLSVVPLQDTIANRGRWPSKVNDCLAAGRAVVLTRVGDAAPLVERARAGWVAAPESGALADTLAQALEDRAARDAAGQHARALAETDLAWSRLATGLADFYERIRQGAGAREGVPAGGLISPRATPVPRPSSPTSEG
jgi:glycosyltransferase involved in cell wall biosynthesis